jgi:molybdopterin biosynthesis enzyme
MIEVQIGAAQGSSQWTSLSRSDCYAVLPADDSDLPAGAPVTCVPFAGLY